MKTIILLLTFLLTFNITSLAQRNTGSDRTGSTDQTDRTDTGSTVNRNPEQTREPIKSPEREKSPVTVIPPKSNTSPDPIDHRPINEPPHRPIHDPVEPIIIDIPPVIIELPTNKPSLNDLSLPEVYELGINRLNNELYSEAIDCFNILLEDDPLDYEVYCLRGRAYHGLEMYERAIKDYKISLKIDSTYAESYYYLGLTELQLGNKEDAIQDFEWASALGYKQADNILKKYFR
ncbi:MAG: tetratricopeptide repeat protein [Ignavibacteriaceae bacterium]